MDWLTALKGYVKGEAAGIKDPSLPESLQPFVAVARATCRLKAMMGSDRPRKALRYMTVLASSLADVPDAGLSPAVIDALAVTYAVRRLEVEPPFGWKRVAKANTVGSDLSSIAAMSRRAGHPLPNQCGPTAAAYLQSRGAGASKENSDAWPIHLADLISIQPADVTSPDWIVWSGLILLSAFCLRPGVIQHLTPEHFLEWDGGFVLIWQWAFKAGAGVDVMDPELKSPVTRISAARFHTLTDLFSRVRSMKHPWRKVSSEAMSEFIRKHFPSAPEGFTLRPYGIRVAADVSAMALDLDEDLTNALFWWRRVLRSMRNYYGALSIRRMYAFSEARTRLKCVHITPGRFDARLRGPLPSFSAKALLKSKTPLPPQPEPAKLQAAWVSDGATLATRRLADLAKTTLPPAVWSALPADAPEGPSSSDDDADSDMSIDCDKCDAHVSRHRRATLCDEPDCPKGRCTRCHTYNTGWRCDEHPPRKARRRAAPRG